MPKDKYLFSEIKYSKNITDVKIDMVTALVYTSLNVSIVFLFFVCFCVRILHFLEFASELFFFLLFIYTVTIIDVKKKRKTKTTGKFTFTSHTSKVLHLLTSSPFQSLRMFQNSCKASGKERQKALSFFGFG